MAEDRCNLYSSSRLPPGQGSLIVLSKQYTLQENRVAEKSSPNDPDFLIFHKKYIYFSFFFVIVGPGQVEAWRQVG